MKSMEIVIAIVQERHVVFFASCDEIKPELMKKFTAVDGGVSASLRTLALGQKLRCSQALPSP